MSGLLTYFFNKIYQFCKKTVIVESGYNEGFGGGGNLLFVEIR